MGTWQAPQCHSAKKISILIESFDEYRDSYIIVDGRCNSVCFLRIIVGVNVKTIEFMSTWTIVIPIYNERAVILRQREYWLSLLNQGIELVFIDGGSSDGSMALLIADFPKVYVAPKGRARQMNLGAEHASGSLIFFLHADTRLPDSFEQTKGLQGCAWGFFLIRLSGRARLLRWVENGINLRSRFFSVATGDQCLFFRRDIFNRLGGFQDIPLMEDIELSRRAKKDYTPVIIPAKVTSSSRRWEVHGVVLTIVFMWGLQLLYRVGVSPHRLHGWYYR